MSEDISPYFMGNDFSFFPSLKTFLAGGVTQILECLP
jgi:hypothetical protein